MTAAAGNHQYTAYHQGISYVTIYDSRTQREERAARGDVLCAHLAGGEFQALPDLVWHDHVPVALKQLWSRKRQRGLTKTEREVLQQDCHGPTTPV